MENEIKIKALTKDEAIEFVCMIFPNLSHYAWDKENFHVDEYDKKGWKHTDAIQVIQFVSPSWDDKNIQITIFPNGFQVWENGTVIPSGTSQFAGHRYLVKIGFLAS